MSRNIEDLADRHFRPDPHDMLADPSSARQARILVAISDTAAHTKSGQDTLWMLTNLLCRQFKLVTAIAYDIPAEIAMLPRVAAFGEASTLRETAANCVRLVAGQHVDVGAYDASSEFAYPIEIFIGQPSSSSRGSVRVVLFADGWRLFLGTRFPDGASCTSDLTLGPYLGACFAAGEVFKRLRGLKEGKGHLLGEDREIFLSLWSCRSAASWKQLDPDPIMASLALPAFYLAGAGAVAQALALALAGMPNVGGYASVADPDSLDLSNDNRYALATLEDDRQSKAPLLARFLNHRGLETFPFPGTWQDFVARSGREPSRSDLDTLERKYLYRLLLSCVDDNSARHAIQNLWPDLIIGGSTYGLTAKAIIYDMSGDQLCLKCFNPVIERNDRVRERIAQALAMKPEDQVRFFAELNIDPVSATAYLHNPGCGKLSEQDLDRFAAGEPMMSVGFVSVAAGVLLAGQLLHLLHSGRSSLTTDGPILIANFYRPGIRQLNSQPEAACDCAERRRTDWSRLWPG
ncbi:ThiF family adenylyltransferase [Bradyrhizobium tunisiense]|uniref:ThiF family adenylyltransferase n=1 Tax=Bradyrhizobium tunisiense TaxID=3278709 RepID=UPI0035D7A6CE